MYTTMLTSTATRVTTAYYFFRSVIFCASRNRLGSGCRPTSILPDIALIERRSLNHDWSPSDWGSSSATTKPPVAERSMTMSSLRARFGALQSRARARRARTMSRMPPNKKPTLDTKKYHHFQSRHSIAILVAQRGSALPATHSRAVPLGVRGRKCSMNALTCILQQTTIS